MAEAQQKQEAASGGSARSTAKSDVMLPEFQPGASSQPVADAEELAKKQEANDAAEAKEAEAAAKDTEKEGPLGHMQRGSDR